ncbi:hypothetical protein ABW20_dc0103896 [Dactylellina cionopaga]|nr:hypothetical protein ABW20_dc0103896 [Dactylellina cionopaga]
MTRSRSVSPTSPLSGQGQGYNSPRAPYDTRDRSVSPTTHSHSQIQRTSFEARQSSQHRSTSRTPAGRNRSNSRGTGTATSTSPRGRPVGPQPPPSIFSHSGPYYLRRSNSDNALSHNFKGAGSTSNPNLTSNAAAWSSALNTISAAARLKPVLPPSFGEPALPDAEADTEAAIQQHYKDSGLEFAALDKQDIFEIADEKLTGKELKNMVVDFGRESAWVAHDVPTEKTEALLGSWEESKRPKEIGTRWM